MAEQKKKRQSIADMKRELRDMQIASRRRQEGKQATGESVAKERQAAGYGQSSKASDKSKYVSPSGKQYAGPGYSAGEAPKPKPKPQVAAPKPKPQAAAPAKPKPKSEPKSEPKPQLSSVFDRRKMTPATSELFISPRAAAAQRGYKEEDSKTKRRRRGQGSRR